MSTEALRAALAAHGGTVASTLTPETSTAGPSAASAGAAAAPGLAASGPRARGREAEYELLLEMILEGSLLHYARGRVVVTEDADLALLLGDQLYAMGLSRLAALGDLDAVAELGDLISLVAQAHLHDDQALADAVWHAGAAAIGWGGRESLQAAKESARAGDPDAVAALDQARDAILSDLSGRGA